MIPPEQVGFREKRGVEDAIARLVQQVQDGCRMAEEAVLPVQEAAAGWRVGAEIRPRSIRLCTSVR